MRQYFSIQVRRGLLRGVRNIGSYYYDDPSSKTNGEFDVVIETKDGYGVYEAKYFKDKMKESDIFQEASQTKKIKELKISRIGFVAVNGFEETDCDYDLISGDQLYA